MDHVQDSPMSTNIISNESMIYHKSVVVLIEAKTILKSKIHILPIYGQTDSKKKVTFVDTQCSPKTVRVIFCLLNQ